LLLWRHLLLLANSASGACVADRRARGSPAFRDLEFFHDLHRRTLPMPGIDCSTADT
jgi:hypothetical protein